MSKDQPLFQDAERALRFAFSICETEIYNSPVYVKEIIRQTGKSSRRAESMSPHDWHAQGSLIRAMVAKLEPLHAAYGFAVYSYSPDRVPAIEIVNTSVHGELPSLKSRIVLEMLVRRHLDRGRAFRSTKSEIAGKAGCHAVTVHNWDKRVKPIMDAIHWDFFDAAERKLTAAGLIPSD